MVERVLQLNKEKTIFWGLLGIIFICACFYMYFINTTVHNVVLRQNLESESSKLTLQIGSQEFEYIKKRNQINLALAHSMGFKETSVKAYITKKSSSEVALLSH